MIIVLGILFAIIGLVSTIIGLGGGTFYLLFMQLFKVPIVLVPIISLICNITVSGLGAVIRIIKKERIPFFLMVLLLFPSMLTSYLGGSIRIQEDKFRLLLNIGLLVIIIVRLVLQLIVDNQDKSKVHISKEEAISVTNNMISLSRLRAFKLCTISGLIGFVSGLIGIGGGIILGPILYIYGFSYARIPLITAIYIFVNSLTGISAKMQHIEQASDIRPYLILPIISIVTVLVAMRFITYRTNSKQVRNIAFLTILLITMYNIIKGGALYVF